MDKILPYTQKEFDEAIQWAIQESKNVKLEYEYLCDEFVFKCRKCEHLLFVAQDKLKNILNMNCPECGEESYENWILVRVGNYEKEYGENEENTDENIYGTGEFNREYS